MATKTRHPNLSGLTGLSTQPSFNYSRALVLLTALSIPLGAFGATAPTGATERVSVDSSGVEGDNISRNASISADGRYVAFESPASNLVAGDSNGNFDVFVHDNQTGVTERVSIDSSGVEGSGFSSNSSISADGRYVAFRSTASNLVLGDSNGAADIFVHDRTTGVTERVSIDSSGGEGSGFSSNPSISADGRYVAFGSTASNLVSGDSNGTLDIFVHDRVTGVTRRVSIDSLGVEGNGNSRNPSISADGRYVAFDSTASNLVAGDISSVRDVFVHDRQTGATERVSIDSSSGEGNGTSSDPSISADGRTVAFVSAASNLVSGDSNGTFDVFVHDSQTSVTERVSVDSIGVEGNNISAQPSISADGRTVAFSSSASNLVLGDSNGTIDIFVRDRQTGITERVSIDSSGGEGNITSTTPSISADGRSVAFESDASNLVSGDSNGFRDVFVHERFGPNQAPGFYAGSDITVCKNAGGQAIQGWATHVTDGNPDVEQSLTFTVNNDNPSLFGGLLNVGGHPGVDANGVLYFRPALNAYGGATMTISLKDGGERTLGGPLGTGQQTFTIYVDPNCDDGAGELFNPGQFDFQFILESVGNIPLDGINFGSSSSGQSKSYKAVVSNNSGKLQRNVTVKMQLSGQEEVLAADKRCDEITAEGLYHCDLDSLPEGDTEFYFQVRAANDVSAEAEVTPQASSASAGNGNSSTSGGGSLGWLSLFGLAVLRRRK